MAEKRFEVETSSEPISATISLGVAGYPKDGTDPNELIHQADLAVYRAKLQGRNRVLGASSEPRAAPARSARCGSRPSRTTRVYSKASSAPARLTLRFPSTRPGRCPAGDQPQRPHTPAGPRFVALSRSLAFLVVAVSVGGIAAGALGFVVGGTHDILGLLAVIALVAGGQALALELEGGSISVSAVGALAGAAIAGPKAALPLAVATAAVEWSSQAHARSTSSLFNIGALSFASLAAAAVFSLGGSDGFEKLITAAAGLVAGGVYFVVNTGLLSRRDGARGPRQLAACLERALLLASAALRRLRRRRRRDRALLRRDRALRPRRLRPAAAPHAQDDGRLPRPHREVHEEAP